MSKTRKDMILKVFAPIYLLFKVIWSPVLLLGSLIPIIREKPHAVVAQGALISSLILTNFISRSLIGIFLLLADLSVGLGLCLLFMKWGKDFEKDCIF